MLDIRVDYEVLVHRNLRTSCSTLNVSMLSDRRDEQCKTLFKQITNQLHILHRLLPAKRDAQLIGRLRSAKLYPTCHAHTARFLKSFIPYSLANFQ